jgi:uncharacterized protein YdhG (YjbR/CyaY superfamily)
MDAAVQRYIEGIAPEHRPLFDRLHHLVLEVHPDVEVVLSYGMPAYQANGRRLHLGVWKHGVSIYGWDQERNAGFVARHPKLVSGAGTIRLRPADADDLSDEELCDLMRGALGA